MVISQGFLLMAAGMGTVGVFLVLMVWVMQAVGLYFKANETRFREHIPATSTQKTVADDSDMVAAALAAVAAHLRKRV